ncbi:uncharacterized protein LOC113563505, partial [Ooceraea biroi]|uniref:uncharacterized protein LOC113563505 n=1 Tax=Ooceraea biroi TaxID=2015173 RepID=UPI000F083516
DINLIKEKYVDTDISINKYHTFNLQGISPNVISTLGSVDIPLLGELVQFHIVPDDINFVQCGILGTSLMRKHNASIDFKNKRLIYDDTCMPFTEVEYIHLEPRSVTPFHVKIVNPEVKSGYIPLIKSVEGIYLGKALVTNINGKAHLPIYNTTDLAYDMEVPSIVLEEYDIANPFENSEISEEVQSAPAARGHAESPVLRRTNRYESLINPSNLEKSPFETQEPCRGKEMPCGNFSWNQSVPDHLGSFSITYKTPQERVKVISQLLRMDHLNSEERDNLLALINDYQDRFQLPTDHLEHTDATQHSIPTITEVPIHQKQYRFSPFHKDEINRQVDALLADGIIEHSTSPYNSPVWIVPKKSDSSGNKRWRMVIDFRHLNEKTIGDAYPLPNITDILDQLGNAKYFTVLDLASGFHQIPMNPKDACKTAFSTPYGHYQYKRMPFGLKNAPSTFQRLMDTVLIGLQGNELFVYVDDIVIYARSLQEHNIKIARLMKRLREANLKLQPDKCEFLRKEVGYLGHIISSEGVKPDPEKVKAIKNFPIPRNAKNIKQFLGLAGYYRRFIPEFSKIAKPLTELLKKDRPFVWESPQAVAFATLQNFLCTEPILQYPDFTQPFILTTDASGYAIGGVLSQGKIGKDLPVAYVSRILNRAEQNYSTIEKECLAMVYCTNHFRPYLYGRKFTIVTDHKPLVWLHSIKDPSSRLWKWRTKLAEFDYDIQYKKGSLNNNADALSRNPPLAVTLPLITDLPDTLDESSNESLFSFPTSRPPDTVISNYDHINEQSQEPIEQPIEIVEEDNQENLEEGTPVNTNEPLNFESEEDIFYSQDSSSEEEDQNELVPRNSVPIAVGEDASRVTITETRDNLLKQSDNLVIFIYLNGNPLDNGARELQSAGLFPKYQDIMYERVKVSALRNKTLIALPLKLNDRTLVETNNIKSCASSLADAIRELHLTSISIRKTNKFDDIPWGYVQKQIIKYLNDLQLRLRPHYYWNTMKKDIQQFIQKCRHCQLRKLTRIKTKQPMIITDTPGRAFDKVSMDIDQQIELSSETYRQCIQWFHTYGVRRTTTFESATSQRKETADQPETLP